TQHNTISHVLIADIQQQLIPLWKLTRLNNNTDLQQFCNAFRERYDEQEIPLALALDTDAGIGYAGYSGGHADHTPLIDDLYLQRPRENNTVSWSKLNDFQLKKLHECLRKGQTEIVL